MIALIRMHSKRGLEYNSRPLLLSIRLCVWFIFRTCERALLERFSKSDLGINVNDVFFPGHGDTSNLQEQFDHLIDTCTQDELEMLLSINREILIHTRKKDSVGEVQTV